MSSTLQIALLIVVPTGLFVAFLRLPRWLSLSLHRHRLWRLRDEVADDMIDGRLPKSDPAVRELLRDVECVIRGAPSLTAIAVHIWLGMRRSYPNAQAAIRQKRASMDELSAAQQKRVKEHRERLAFLCAGSILLGTWVGIATILRFVIPAIRGRQRADLGVTLRAATDRAANDTWLGRRSREFAEELDGEPTHQPAGIGLG